jgi:hypothetical protein
MSLPFRCDCGAFMPTKPIKVEHHKLTAWCDGRPKLVWGRLSLKSPVDRAILEIKGAKHVGDQYEYERLAPCNETEELHMPHHFITDEWYDHYRKCTRCGKRKVWWSYVA